MVELKRMPYAMAAYKTYRRPANDNAGCVSMDDALLKNDRSGYSHDRFFSMADSMTRTGLDPFQISIGLLCAALDIAAFNGGIEKYLDFQDSLSKKYRDPIS